MRIGLIVRRTINFVRFKMGYRSDVVIRLNKNARDKMPENVKKELESSADEIKELEDGGAIYDIRGVKWYTEYEDVKAIEDFLDSLDINDEDEEYELVRCGEDDPMDNVAPRYNCVEMVDVHI